MQFNLGLLSIGSYDYSNNELTAVYKEGIRYLCEADINKANGTYYYDINTYEDFDVITLNGSFESTDGKKPTKVYSVDNAFKLDKSRVFKYDKVLQKHVYGCYDNVSNLVKGNKGCLSYELGLKNSGTIHFRFKFDLRNSERYLIEFNNGQLSILAVSISRYHNIEITINGTKHNSKKIVNDSIWHDLTIRYKARKVEIWIDSLEKIFETTEIINLSGTIAYLGNIITTTKALNGYIEMFAYTDKYVDEAKIAKIISNGSAIVVRERYDTIGRIVKNQIIINDQNYDINYEYDSNNNICIKEYKNIVNENIVTTEERYEYDLLGRLKKEIKSNGDIVEYTYDGNGNILYKQTTSNNIIIKKERYEYDVNIKDRLNRIVDEIVNGEKYKIEYKENNEFKPKAIIKNAIRKEISWENNRIIRIGENEYSYNSEGIRTKKETANETTTYEIDNNEIIEMTKETLEETVTIGFVYDAKGKLVAATTSEGNYFYIRDITGDIIGLVDSTGNYVVKYQYDAWGVPTKQIIINKIISRHNPFIYKGYYYDEETNLFLVTSRYYSPELGRFIQPADVSSLNPSSINGLNLYTYAVNNPIAIKYDSSVSSYGSEMVSSIDFGASSVGVSSVFNQAAPEWIKLLVGAIPDLKVGLDSLKARGTKSSFAYATAKTYRFPILGGTHSAFTKGKYSYGDLVGASFRKITTDSARGGFGAFAKNFAKTSVYTLGVNFAFNYYENNWQIDDAMLQDTLIDTAIGVSSYYMAAGTMSLLTAGVLVAFGWNVPGLIVVGGVVGLSIAYDALIRWITGYDEWLI